MKKIDISKIILKSFKIANKLEFMKEKWRYISPEDVPKYRQRGYMVERGPRGGWRIRVDSSGRPIKQEGAGKTEVGGLVGLLGEALDKSGYADDFKTHLEGLASGDEQKAMNSYYELRKLLRKMKKEGHIDFKLRNKMYSKLRKYFEQKYGYDPAKKKIDEGKKKIKEAVPKEEKKPEKEKEKTSKLSKELLSKIRRVRKTGMWSMLMLDNIDDFRTSMEKFIKELKREGVAPEKVNGKEVYRIGSYTIEKAYSDVIGVEYSVAVGGESVLSNSTSSVFMDRTLYDVVKEVSQKRNISEQEAFKVVLEAIQKEIKDRIGTESRTEVKIKRKYKIFKDSFKTIKVKNIKDYNQRIKFIRSLLKDYDRKAVVVDDENLIKEMLDSARRFYGRLEEDIRIFGDDSGLFMVVKSNGKYVTVLSPKVEEVYKIFKKSKNFAEFQDKYLEKFMPDGTFSFIAFPKWKESMSGKWYAYTVHLAIPLKGEKGVNSELYIENNTFAELSLNGYIEKMKKKGYKMEKTNEGYVFRKGDYKVVLDYEDDYDWHVSMYCKNSEIYTAKAYPDGSTVATELYMSSSLVAWMMMKALKKGDTKFISSFDFPIYW